MIEAINVNKTFDGRQILKDINVTIERGKVNMIIGQSGAGKSVFFKCLVGLHDIDSGDVQYDGRDFTKMEFKERKKVRQEIGMLFQAGALFDSQTVEQNVMFPLDMFTDMSYEEKLERVNFCLDRVNIVNSNKLFPGEISGGMKKRVAIARAIAMKPKYLFCDEPNSGLDPRTSIVIDNLIKDLTEEYDMTTVVISHDMNSVIEIGDRISFIHEGQLWWSGTKEEILKTENPEVNEFVYASKFMQIVKKNL